MDESERSAERWNWRVKRLGHLDLPGAGQVTVRGRYAYVGHMKPPHGTTILDVSDPQRPRIVSSIALTDPYSHTHKMHVVGDLMIVNVEQNNRYLLRKGATIPAATARLAEKLGRTPTDKDQLWSAFWYAGFHVLDVSDIRRPHSVAHYNYHPPFPEPTHTALRVPFPVGGRQIALVVDEEHEHRRGRPHAGLWVFDVGDLADIRPIATFEVSELDSPWSRAGGRFGAHQFQERMTGTPVCLAWFAAGLRIVDIADPTQPEKVGFFIPEPVAGQPYPQTNDVDMDDRGLIYIGDRQVGFDVLEYLGLPTVHGQGHAPEEDLCNDDSWAGAVWRFRPSASAAWA